jgi:hypothetical protein
MSVNHKAGTLLMHSAVRRRELYGVGQIGVSQQILTKRAARKRACPSFEIEYPICQKLMTDLHSSQDPG